MLKKDVEAESAILSEKSPVISRLVLGWSKVYKLNKSRAKIAHWDSSTGKSYFR